MSTMHWGYLDAGNLIGIYYEQSQLDMAILHYKQAINCDSTFIEAYNNLGNALKDARHYKSSFALQPNHPQALSSLGNIYMDCNMMSVAASFYKATLAVTTGISTPFNNLAIIYKQQGNYAEAIACYNEVLHRLLLMVLSIEGTRWHQSGAQAFYARVFAGTFGSRMPDLLIVSTSFLHLGTDRKSLLRFRSGTEAGLRGLVFDLNLPPAEPSDRRFMVGYALLPKKQRSLIRPSLMSPARDRGVYLVPVDPWRPLAEQGHFNCVIHKLYAGEWMARLADFAAKSPGVPIVDHPLAIERLHNHDRIAMLHQVSKLNAPHGTETFGIPNQALLHDFSAGPSLG
ncbi:hypothetical protein ZIOFF_010260 [Zingiber officinale]|uniref:Inositol-tetrakisphosphate 1-kinase N-terminal domain-containing protein n=1 Tax=Zingiber officinale TaxID=94328 RepID=A0A8J5I3Y4_ZINOF|nr:hypothetical protein ZIOFF_010260 [Zingiber officinale]